MSTRLLPIPRVRLLAAGAVAALAVISGGAQRSQTADQVITAKLTSVLQDLARTVTQDTQTTSRPAAAPLNLQAMPASVQDASRGGTLRLNAAGDVQIVVLM